MSDKPQIVNIINFIRGVEPRNHEMNLFEPVERQLELILKYNLPATFLLQYDAMLQEKYIKLLKPAVEKGIETGIWLEIVQPLAEKAGIKWRGRQGFSWDWHSNVGFSVGYTLEERLRMIDIFMEDFTKIFGFYPESAGSWAIDAQTLSYMKDKYDIKASCNCKDQWGTDGYTLWGGYYNGAYYPSRKNVFTPAQTADMQINVPVFRMLGSDPVDQYDAGMDDSDGLKPSDVQSVITLEPAYPFGGGSPKWVDWFFSVIFSDDCLSFGYTQSGQENSFGWKDIESGFTYQIEQITKKSSEGKLKVMTLSDSGKWYAETYNLTPASLIAAIKDISGQKSSVWYYNRFYRSNFYVLENIPRLRDIFLFKQDYEERYLNDVCDSENMVYDNLPVVDGNRWSHGSVRAGIYFVDLNKDEYNILRTKKEPRVREISSDEMEIKSPLAGGGELTVRYSAKSVLITVTGIENWGLYLMFSNINKDTKINTDKSIIHYEHNLFQYNVEISGGKTDYCENGIMIRADKADIELRFN